MGQINLPSEHVWETVISTYDVDRNRNLTLSSLLKLQQEIGEKHLKEAGLSYGVMYDMGKVFIITKITSMIHRLPVMEEKVKIVTWSKGVSGVSWLRHYTFYSMDGTCLVESAGSFVLVDAEDHKLVRPGDFPLLTGIHYPDRSNGCGVPRKIRFPSAYQNSGAREIRYSDIDYNGHLNNTIYADFLYDYMPKEMRGKEIGQFTINFINEVKENHIIVMDTAVEGKDIYYRGSGNNKICFTGLCKTK